MWERIVDLLNDRTISSLVFSVIGLAAITVFAILDSRHGNRRKQSASL